jgi:hypothetical protein
MEAAYLVLKILGLLHIGGSLEPSMVEAFIQAGATILAAAIAALIVIYQVDRSGRHSREQVAEGERLKFNLSIYGDVITACDAACDQSVALQGLLLRLQLDLENAKLMPPGRAQTSFRPLSISPTFDATMASSIHIMRLVERWAILDTRLRVFQTALNVVNHDLRTAYHQDLFPLLLRSLPYDLPEGIPSPPWTPPDPALRQDLDRAIQRVQAAAATLNYYGMDFQVEMQDLLLKHLGTAKIRRRTPLDPNVLVISLERAEALELAFENTAWAVDRRAAERRATEAIRTRDAENHKA